MGSGGSVTTPESRKSADGDSQEFPSADFRYTKFLEDACSTYMAWGMSYNDYWYGDTSMARFYREAHEKKRIEENENLWLQGMYIYEAILDCAPVLNALSKKKDVFPYRDAPIPITKTEIRRKEEKDARDKFKAQKEYMMRMREIWNKQFEEKGGST